MRVPKWPRTDEIGERYVLEAIRSHQWGATGLRWTDESFETRFSIAFAEYHGSPYCLTTLNGSTAIELALLALGISPGDQVLVPAMTWVSCATAVHSVGALPVFVDVDESDLCMDIGAAEQALAENPRCSAILLVHAYCSIAPLDTFEELAERYGVHLIEDCSQCHGASWEGRKCGTFGVCGVFSMQSSKVLSSGEGGAVLFQHDEHYRRAQRLRLDGRVPSSNPVGRSLVTTIDPIPGRNRTITEFQHALLLRGLELLDEENGRRNNNALMLGSILSSNGVHHYYRSQTAIVPSPYRFVYRFDKSRLCKESVDEHIACLIDAGIPASRLHLPIPLNPAAPTCARQDKKFVRENYPNACRLFQTSITLTHQCLLMDSRDIETLSEFVLGPNTCN